MSSAQSGSGGLHTNPMALISDSDSSDISSDEDSSSQESARTTPRSTRTGVLGSKSSPPRALGSKSASPPRLASRLKFEGRGEVLMPWERSSQGSRNGSVTPPSARKRSTSETSRATRSSSDSGGGEGNASVGGNERGPEQNREGPALAIRKGDTLMPWESDGPPPPSPVPSPANTPIGMRSTVPSPKQTQSDGHATGEVEPVGQKKDATESAPRSEAGRSYVFGGGTQPETAPTLEPEPEIEPPDSEIRREQEEVTLKMWTMSFNMECGDPFKHGQSDIDLHSFIPTNCDVYVVGLQEAGGEIKNVPPSPSAPGPAEPQDGLYNMIEMYLLGEPSHIRAHERLLSCMGGGRCSFNSTRIQRHTLSFSLSFRGLLLTL
jgi:hypothetical protein